MCMYCVLYVLVILCTFYALLASGMNLLFKSIISMLSYLKSYGFMYLYIIDSKELLTDLCIIM